MFLTTDHFVIQANIVHVLCSGALMVDGILGAA